MIDHFMYGVPDLGSGLAWAQQTFGVAAQPGGSHPGLGTCNALLSLGDTYLEIIAPDPAQTLTGTFGARLAGLSTGGLITWAARGDLQAIKASLTTRGMDCAGPVPTSRATPEGTMLAWELLFPRGHTFAGLFPFFIDWKQCVHPSQNNPQAGELTAFTITLREAQAFAALLDPVARGPKITDGDRAMCVEIATSAGTVTLTTTPESQAIRAFV